MCTCIDYSRSVCTSSIHIMKAPPRIAIVTQCLVGGAVQNEDPQWLKVKAGYSVRFFDGDLVTHFQAEEEFLLPM